MSGSMTWRLDPSLTRERASGGSAPSTPRRNRKRLRSLTPSEVGLNGTDSDVLRSPLAKRKKLAMDRSGSSKLKEAITADDLGITQPADELPLPPPKTSPSGSGNDDEDDEDDDSNDTSDEEGAVDEEDDFLARELEWG